MGAFDFGPFPSCLKVESISHSKVSQFKIDVDKFLAKSFLNCQRFINIDPKLGITNCPGPSTKAPSCLQIPSPTHQIRPTSNSPSSPPPLSTQRPSSLPRPPQPPLPSSSPPQATGTAAATARSAAIKARRTVPLMLISLGREADRGGTREVYDHASVDVIR